MAGVLGEPQEGDAAQERAAHEEPGEGGALGVEAERVDAYLIFLFVLLSTATLFDGFDAAMLTVAAPDVRATLGIDLGEWGYLFAFTRLGMIASFFLLLTADRIGRRRLMTWTIVGFALTNTAAGFATGKYEFAVWQFLARIFLTAEYALAIIVVGEEFPARRRGLAIAILTSFATIGVMIIARVQPYILLRDCVSGTLAAGNCVAPASNAFRDLGMEAVATVQTWIGRPVDGAGWRILYLIGVAPLTIVFVLRFALRETRRFAAEQARRAKGSTRFVDMLRDEWAKARVPWQPEYRRRTWLVALLWNCVQLVTSPAVAYWVIFAREQLHFTPAIVGGIIFWGYAGGVAGNYLAGYLIERFGRRATVAVVYVFSALSIATLFQVQSEVAQYVSMIFTVFGFGAANTATHVYASELFPTAIRATGYGWTTNLFGRIAEFGTPLLIAVLIQQLGVTISTAVLVVSVGPLIGAAIVWRFAPETRGLTLEEVQRVAAMGHEGTVPAKT
jgi:putative MFS transporter